MSSKIQLLDSQTINRIAAGEVIENSASVLKELLENAIDAGASSIHIELLAGGKQLLRITDDGCGMTHEELRIAVQRHATSKLRTIEDLDTIATMGFRGEALAAIAAVSKLDLRSSIDGVHGYRLLLEGGIECDAGPLPCSKGTTIEVRSLFYNTPARKKFQKSIQADLAACQRVVTHLALAHPQLHFRLLHDGERLIHTSASHQTGLTLLTERALELFGREWREQMLPIEMEEEGICLYGLLSVPSQTRHNRTGQVLFLNKRLIQSSLVSQAITQGYGTLFGARQHPLFLLHLTLPSSWIDVNVHPQKSQVRLLNERLLFTRLSKWVGRTLHPHMPQPASWQTPTTTSWSSPTRFCDPPPTAPLPWEDSPTTQTSCLPRTSPYPTIQTSCLPRTPPIIALWEGFLLVDGATLEPPIPQTLLLIDQQRMLQRLMIEQQSKTLPPSPLQELTLPLELPFTQEEQRRLLEAKEDLATIGIALAPFGPHTLLIEALAPHLSPQTVTPLLEEFLASGQSLSTLPSKLSLCSRPLSLTEAETLLAQLLMLPYWHTLPNGQLCFHAISKGALSTMKCDK